MSDNSQFWLENLPAYQGKLLKLKVRRSKEVDNAPGTASSGFYYEDYTGVVMNPAIRPYPENNPEGVVCVFILGKDATKTIFAIPLDSIEEVDDEIQENVLQEVAISSLTIPDK